MDPTNERSATKWFQQLRQLSSIVVPRCLCLPNSQQQLHVFADASNLACGAAVYVRNQMECEEVPIRHVAPLQTISIPSLELMAAVLASELAAAVASIMQIQLKDAVFRTDSMEVFHLVRQLSRQYKPFVAH